MMAVKGGLLVVLPTPKGSTFQQHYRAVEARCMISPQRIREATVEDLDEALIGYAPRPTPAQQKGEAFRAMHSQCGLEVYAPFAPKHGVKDMGLDRCPSPECTDPDAPWWRQDKD